MLKELDLTATGNNPDIAVYGNYAMWWGMYYRGHGGGMLRMGGKLVYQGQTFKTLISDWDAFQPATTERVHASHPDDEVMVEFIEQNGPNRTNAMWFSNQTEQRSPIDTNAAREDGSVNTFKQVAWDEASLLTGDRRVEKVPIRADDPDTSTNWMHLPRQN